MTNLLIKANNHPIDVLMHTALLSLLFNTSFFHDLLQI
jgi:hypothetical protein